MKALIGLGFLAALGFGVYAMTRPSRPVVAPSLAPAGAGYQPLTSLAAKQPGLAPFFGAAQSALGGVFAPGVNGAAPSKVPAGTNPNDAAAIGTAAGIAGAGLFVGLEKAFSSPPVPVSAASGSPTAARATTGVAIALPNDWQGGVPYAQSQMAQQDPMSANQDVSGNTLNTWGLPGNDPLVNLPTGEDNYQGAMPGYVPSDPGLPPVDPATGYYIPQNAPNDFASPLAAEFASPSDGPSAYETALMQGGSPLGGITAPAYTQTWDGA